MKDKLTIFNLLNKFSKDHKNVTWKLKCAYSDGMGTNINQIKIFSPPNKRNIGIFSYRVETGEVLFCMYKGLKNGKSQNIIDILLDMMNYSKGQAII